MDHSPPPPPYSQKSAGLAYAVPRPSLATSMSEARADINERIVVDTIIPYLHSAAVQGIAHTRLVLMPHEGHEFDSKIPEGTTPGPVLGFSSTHSVRVVNLPESTGSIEFWKQSNIIPELVLRLKHALLTAGDNVRMKQPEPVEVKRPVDLPSPSTGRGFFKRKPSKPRPDVEGVDPDINGTIMRLAPGEIDITAGIQMISYRTETEMGLMETRSDRVVVVTMEIGTNV